MPPENTPGADDGKAGGSDGGGQAPNPGDKKPDGSSGADPGDQGGDKGGSGAPGAGSSGFDLSKLPEDAQKVIKDLRGENAKYRNKAKTFETDLGKANGNLAGIKKALGLETEKDLTQDDFDSLTQANSASEFRSAVLESAVQHGIAHKNLDYFQYLVEKRTTELEEGEELTNEHLSEIATQVKTQQPSGTGKTSVGDGKGGDGGGKPAPSNDSGVTLDSFVKMTITEKSGLFEKNPELYKRLFSEAKDAHRLV